MNYLDRASKHIVSSHHIRRKTKVPSGFYILVAVIVLFLVYFVGKNFINDLVFGIRKIILPGNPSEITLNSGALESQLKALEKENVELKRLLENSGVRIPNFLNGNQESSESIEQELESEFLENNIARENSIEDTDISVGTGTASTSISQKKSSSTSRNIVANSDILDTEINANTQSGEGKEDESKQNLQSRKITLSDRDVISTVLMRPPQSPYDALVIDRGQDMGISEGDQVYIWQGFPIGEVVTVYKDRSIVKLFSAPGNKIEVFIGTSTNAVQAEGKGGGNFFLKLPKVSDIKEGDLVARSFLPPEVFSQIESVDSNAGEAYTYAYFKLPVNLHNLVYVLVKKDSNQ